MTHRTLRCELRFIAAIAVLAAAIALSGCNDPGAVAAKAANDVATAIGAAETTIGQLQAGGTISATEAKNILGYLNAANSLDSQFISCIGTVHAAKGAASGYLTCAQTFLNGLQDPAELANLRVSNPASQQKVDLVVNSVTLILQTVITALSGSK